MNKAKFEELAWWALKWVVAGTIVAAIVVVAVQTYNRLDRHNLLVDALVRDIQQIQVLRQQAEQRRQNVEEQVRKAQQELPKFGDPKPTEERAPSKK